MMIPLQITFRDFESSEAVEARIRKRAEALNRFAPHLTACRVIVEAPHRHHQKGKLYHVRVECTLPGHDIVVSREGHDQPGHSDVYVAIRDAFDAAKRELEDRVRLLRGATKTHEVAPHGRIVRLFPHMDYGMIQTPDGREIYFHRNSMIGASFDELREGIEVRFVEQEGENGPQASSVRLVGRHHLPPVRTI
jgi:cold shock CspA family protein/ribosome-associated translation inhibitor RaiA